MTNNTLFSNNEFDITSSPTSEYYSWLEKTNTFFDGPTWGAVLIDGFDVKRYYIWDKTYTTGRALTVFKKGPFKVGYLGFPIYSQAEIESESYSVDRMLNAIALMKEKPHILRLPASAFSNLHLNIKKCFIENTVESCITDLCGWNDIDTSTRRRDLRYAQKRLMGNNIIPDYNISSDEAFNIYNEAIKRNLGKLRYSKKYFESLTNKTNAPWVSFFSMREEKHIKNLTITVRHADTVYYLHGGGTPEALRAGASDLAMSIAITDAKNKGAKRFNFLSSPEKQPGLIRFKEKWGGESRQALTYSIPLTRLGSLIIFVLRILQKK